MTVTVKCDRRSYIQSFYEKGQRSWCFRRDSFSRHGENAKDNMLVLQLRQWQRRLPALFNDSLVMSTTSSRAVCDPPNKRQRLRREMFAVIDRMLGALTERFSSDAPELIAFSTVNPDYIVP
jgi:hypothetical protein